MGFRKYLVFMLIFGLCSCGQNLPDYEKRDIEVTQTDLEILIRANELLNSEELWNRNSIRTCRKDHKELSLFCALMRASRQITGKYEHRRAAIQEVRFVIDDQYRTRWSKHRLADFNGNADTSFEDIKKVIEVAISKVKSKIST